MTKTRAQNELQTPLRSGSVSREVRFWDEFTWRVFVAFLFPAMGGLLFGYDVGSTSVIKLTLKNSYPQVENDSFINGLFTSASLIGATIGSALAFQVGDLIGRRKTLLLAAFLYTVGGVVSGVAVNLTMVIAGKIVWGSGIGFVMHSAPVYISETAPSGIRGILVSMKEALIVLGMVLGNFTGFVFSSGTEWRYIFLIGPAIAVLFGFGMLCLPETARWLAYHEYQTMGHVSDKVKNLLSQTMSKENGINVDDEIEQMIFTFRTAESSSFESLASCRKQLIVGLGLVVFQQVTGQPSVLYYTGELLDDAIGNGNSNTAAAASLVTSVKFLATAVSVTMVDKLGRKILLQIGTLGMICATIGLSISFHVYGNDESNIVNVFILMVYVAFYQVGFGPMTWLIISEIFPLVSRSRAVSLSVFTNFAGNIGVTFFYPVMTDAMGDSMVFVVYSIMCLLSLVFVQMRLPETKGKSLEEIQHLFAVY